MNKTTIEKIFKLIENNNLSEVKQLLKLEMLKCEKTKNIKLIDAIKKYLKNSEKLNGDSRPILKTIMNKNNIQYVCDGFSLYVFNEYIKEFEVLKNSYEKNENVINYEPLIKNNVKYENINDFDMKILMNIKKIVSYYKTLDGVDKKGLFIIPFANKLIDAKKLLQFSEILQNDFNGLKLYYDNQKLQPFQFSNKKITSIILPCRILKENENEIYNKILKDFFDMVEE